MKGHDSITRPMSFAYPLVRMISGYMLVRFDDTGMRR